MRRLNIILIIFYSTLLNAQILKVSVDKNPAVVGEQIIVQYTIDTKAGDFTSPDFNGLQVLSGPNQSSQSSYTFVNGKSQSNISTTYSFYLKAKKEGTYSITPATITLNREKIASNPFTLNVVKGKVKNKNQQQEISNNLFVKATASKKNIVVGEQILVTYSLFTRIELQNTEISLLPALNGFWVKDLKSSSQFKREIIDGVAYNVATIKKSVLTAQKHGELTLDPIELTCNIRLQQTRNSHDPFASFFGRNYQTQEERIRSRPITIMVASLPEAPDNFKGAVGKIEIKSEVDNNNTNANDAINYKITITGTGNIELIEPLNIQFPEDFEVYDPKISNKIFEGGLKRSIKTFEYLLIPRYKGEYTIPNSELIVFNPKNKTYEKKTSGKHEITINASKNNESEKFSTNKQIVRSKKEDINYIANTTELKPIGKNSIPQNLFYFLFCLPIILFIVYETYNKIIGKRETDSIERKTRKANEIAQKRLKNAKKCIKTDDFSSFFEEIEKSLWGYFADKFKVSASELSKKTITNYFNSSKIDKEIEQEFISLLNDCEFSRYAPKNNRNTQMDTILEKAKEIIIKVEKALK